MHHTSHTFDICDVTVASTSLITVRSVCIFTRRQHRPVLAIVSMSVCLSLSVHCALPLCQYDAS